jgi:hypothetical protein
MLSSLVLLIYANRWWVSVSPEVRKNSFKDNFSLRFKKVRTTHYSFPACQLSAGLER